MAFIAVFLISLSSLAFEVLLTRVFSINQWNHLSFMVIGIALLGFAGGGTWLSILDARVGGWEKRLSTDRSMLVIITLYTAATIFSFTALNNLPLDYYRMPLEPIQGLYLLLAFVLLTLPFLLAGIWLAVAFAAFPEKTGKIYFASMAGSACGAALPAALLPVSDEGRLIVIAAMIPTLVLPGCLRKKTAGGNHAEFFSPRQHRIAAAALVLIIVGGVFLVSAGERPWLSVTPSPYKSLSQTLRLPDTRLVSTQRDIAARIDQVDSPYIRFAPGLSLKYSGRLPEQSGIFRDGDSRLVMYRDLDPKTADFARKTLSYAGYQLAGNPERVLIVQTDGGVAVACAVASGAGSVTVVEKNPEVARRLSDHYGITVYPGHFRKYLQRIDRPLDVIHIESWGTSLAGSAALDQQYEFTKDSFARFLNHLTAEGALIISRKLQLPPSDSLRMWATAYQALAELGVEEPAAHLLMLRNWDTYTLVIFRNPTGERPDVATLLDEHNFDLVFFHRMDAGQVNRYAVFEKPYHHLEVMRLYRSFLSGQPDAMLRAYPLDIAPQTDDRPFPSRFIKWHRLPDLYKSTGSRLYYLLMSGEIIVAVVLMEAIVVSALLLGLPTIIARKKQRPSSGSRILYFLCVGSGFMFIELYYIKQFILVFAHPTISFTVAVSGMLVFSAFGGLLSEKLPSSAVKGAIVMLLAALAATTLFCHSLLSRIIELSAVWKIVASLTVMAPSAILAGIPFPAGMRTLLHSPVNRTRAWTANGCASIVASIVSIQVALTLGVSFIMLGAIAVYLIALIGTYGNRGEVLLRLSR